MPGNQKRMDTTGTPEVELNPVSSPSVSTSSVLDSDREDVQYRTEKVILHGPYT